MNLVTSVFRPSYKADGSDPLPNDWVQTTLREHSSKTEQKSPSDEETFQFYDNPEFSSEIQVNELKSTLHRGVLRFFGVLDVELERAYYKKNFVLIFLAYFLCSSTENFSRNLTQILLMRESNHFLTK